MKSFYYSLNCMILEEKKILKYICKLKTIGLYYVMVVNLKSKVNFCVNS